MRLMQTLDHRRMRCVALSFAGLMLAAGCGRTPTPQGTLSGHLYMVGGPSPGAARPVTGEVVATGPGGRHTIRVGVDGAYAMRLAPGNYAVVGFSPAINDGESPCAAPGQVTVVSNAVRTADAECQDA